MTTVANIITSARYDLLDEDETQYSDAMLIDFLNRGLRPFCTVLSMLKSDWVNESTTLTLSVSSNSVALPTYFISPISAFIDTDELVKKSVSWIREYRLDSTAGEPDYYAIQGTNFIVERTTDQEYSITFEYNKGLANLTSDSDMPYNDEFNDVLRQFMVICAKSRNEYSLMRDAAMQDYFYQAVYGKLVARSYVPNINRTNF